MGGIAAAEWRRGQRAAAGAPHGARAGSERVRGTSLLSASSDTHCSDLSSFNGFIPCPPCFPLTRRRRPQLQAWERNWWLYLQRQDDLKKAARAAY